MQATVPQLHLLHEFEDVLRNYRPSSESIRTFNSTRSAFFVGPSSGGRNTLINELKKTGQYVHILSDTTRPQRMHDGRLEENGEFSNEVQDYFLIKWNDLLLLANVFF